MQETTIETKACKHCWISFEITDKDLEFYDKVSPIFNKTKYSIPSPTFCPKCRHQRRLSFRNERNLYKRKCDLTGENIISCYNETTPFKIYKTENWWWDKWDAMDYGQDFDFDRPFFEQFAELTGKVPRMALLLANTENADYNNYASFLKDCYLAFDSSRNENAGYLYNTSDSKNTFDCMSSNTLENCYECTDSFNCYKLFYSNNCESCNDSYFLFNCVNCTNCINCMNLVGKQYYINNERYSKEEYEKEKKKILSNIKQNKINFKKFISNKIYKSSYNKNCENSSGDYLLNSKNVQDSYDLFFSENCKYCSNSTKLTDCYDYESCAGPSELGLELNGTMQCYHNLFGLITWWRNLYYCDHATDCNDCFGCVWTRNKQYCIFNKKYSKEDYEKIVPQIIEHMKTTGEWGEFFPSTISPFAYNETLAQDYYPLDKKQATEKWFKWMDKEYPINIPEGMARIEAKDLPALKKLNKDLEKKILNTAIICEDSWKPYRITQQELNFYKKNNLPIPQKHPNIRYIERMNLRNPRKLYDKKCDKCEIDIKTTYSPDRPETVFCQACYSEEVY